MVYPIAIRPCLLLLSVRLSPVHISISINSDFATQNRADEAGERAREKTTTHFDMMSDDIKTHEHRLSERRIRTKILTRSKFPHNLYEMLGSMWRTNKCNGSAQRTNCDDEKLSQFHHDRANKCQEPWWRRRKKRANESNRKRRKSFRQKCRNIWQTRTFRCLALWRARFFFFVSATAVAVCVTTITVSDRQFD